MSPSIIMIFSLFLLILLVEAPARVCGGPIMVKFDSDGRIEPMDESELMRNDETDALTLRSTPKPPSSTSPTNSNIFVDESRAFLSRSKKQADEAIRRNRRKSEIKNEPIASNECLCPICKDDLDTEETVETKCNHSFHKSCIVESRCITNVNFTPVIEKCPVCRTVVDWESLLGSKQDGATSDDSTQTESVPLLPSSTPISLNDEIQFT